LFLGACIGLSLGERLTILGLKLGDLQLIGKRRLVMAFVEASTNEAHNG